MDWYVVFIIWTIVLSVVLLIPVCRAMLHCIFVVAFTGPATDVIYIESSKKKSGDWFPRTLYIAILREDGSLKREFYDKSM